MKSAVLACLIAFGALQTTLPAAMPAAQHFGSNGAAATMLRQDMRKLWTDDVVARLTKNWAVDVKAFDAVYDHILAMSDALSDGIIKQFPPKFEVIGTTGR